MNLTVPAGIKKGDPITAAFLSDICAALRAITPQNSADILVSTNSGGTTFRQAFKPRERIAIRYGEVQADFTNGTLINIKDCGGDGVTSGDAFNVYADKDSDTVDLRVVTIAGSTVSGMSCKLAQGSIIAYTFGGGTGAPYMVGDVEQIIYDIRYDTTSHKLQAKVYWRVGIAVSTVSDWIDVRAYTAVDAMTGFSVDQSTGVVTFTTTKIYTPETASGTSITHTGEKSQATPCTAPGS